MKTLLLFCALCLGASFVNSAFSQGMGIGIATPASVLHVYESTTNIGANAGLTIQQNGTGDAVTQYLLTGGQRWVTGIDNSDGDKFKIASAADLSSASARLTIMTTGFTGIGIVTPVSLFHIYENTANTGTTTGLTIEQDGTGDAVTQYLLTGGQRWVTGIDNSDADKFKIATGVDLNTEARLTIMTGGNTGIGIATPISVFHVFENTGSTGTTAGLTIEQNGAGDAVTQYLLTGGQRWVSGIDNSDEDRFKISSGTDLDASVGLTIQANGNIGAGVATGATLPQNLVIGPTNTGNTGASGHPAISRNVTNDALEILGGTGEATGAYFKITGLDNSTMSPYEGSAEFVIRNLPRSQFSLFSYDGASTWTNRFSLRGLTGYVGIGTDNPASLLDVRGANSVIGVRGTNNDAYSSSLRILGNHATNFRGGYFQYDENADQFIMGVHDADNAATGSDLEIMRINRAGTQIGFSTGDTERFRIPNANQVHAMSLGTAALPFYSFSADPNTGMYSPGADQLSFSTGGTERVRILANGNTALIPNGGSLTIGGGAGITQVLSSTVAWNPANIANNANTTTTITVTGAAVGDNVIVSLTTLTNQQAILTGNVSSANTVTVMLRNVTGAALDLGNGTLRATVIKF